MKQKKTIGMAFFILLTGFGLLIDHSYTLGARVAGEKGVAPAAPRVAPGKRRSVARPNPPEKPMKESSTHEETEKDSRYVTIDFDNVDIGVFIKFISELTGKNFVVDKGVRGKVTILSPTKISVKQAYKVFESVLEVHGYTTVPAGNIIKIVPAVQARSKEIETRLEKVVISPEDRVVTQLIPLKYADPDRLKKTLSPLVSKSSVVVSYPPAGMLIVTDVLSNIRRLMRIIEAIDVEGIGEEISVIPLEHATATVMAKSLNMVFQRSPTRTKKGVALRPLVRVVPDERTNTVIILASEDDTFKIKRLVELLDKERPKGEGDIRVYYLQNANAEELAKVLSAIPTQQGTEAKKGKVPVISKGVKIVPDKATNSLVITAGRADYRVLEDVIRKLDVPRRMVYIEALLMEVSLNKEFALGVQWQGGDTTGSHRGRKIGIFGASIPSDPLMSNAMPSGFSLGVLGDTITIGGIQFPNISAVVRALQNDADVHILSTPQIMTTDNEEAEIVVANNIPFLTRQERTEGNLDFSNYEFKDVGVTLKITPQINQDRFVRLKLSQEVSQVSDDTTLGLPTTLKRSAKTTVIIKDGQTLVIGGLIDKTLNASTYKVPVLGDIPLLGNLFKSKSRSDAKTNLFIFITPHIVENPSEAKKVYEEKREEIEKIREGVIKMYKREKPSDR